MSTSSYGKTDPDITGWSYRVNRSLPCIIISIIIYIILVVLAIMISKTAAYKKTKTLLTVFARASAKIEIEDHRYMSHKSKRIIRCTAIVRIVIAAVTAGNTNCQRHTHRHGKIFVFDKIKPRVVGESLSNSRIAIFCRRNKNVQTGAMHKAL